MNAFDTQLDSATNESPASLLALAALVFVTSALVTRLRAHADAKSPQKLEDVTVYHLGSPTTEY